MASATSTGVCIVKNSLHCAHVLKSTSVPSVWVVLCLASIIVSICMECINRELAAGMHELISKCAVPDSGIERAANIISNEYTITQSVEYSVNN
jgi:hypothetical protein